MQTGTVDIRTRDNQRHGKVRVNALVDMLNDLYPKPSKRQDDFYKKMWNFDDFKDIPVPEPKPVEEVKDAVKLDHNKKKEAAPKKEKEAAPKKEKQQKKGKQEQKVNE